MLIISYQNFDTYISLYIFLLYFFFIESILVYRIHIVYKKVNDYTLLINYIRN